jgi:NADH:ubiquinone reductase (H+-translocating)
VEKDLSVPGHPRVFVIGDAARLDGKDGQPLPGVSPVAMQEARTVAKSIRRALVGRDTLSFRYFDKGSMATIGRRRAIAMLDRMHLSGFLAWMAWLLVHIWYLIGFRNRLVVLITWAWSYVTYRRGARLITGYGRRAAPAAPLAHAREVGEATWSDQGSGWSDPGKRAGGAGQ